MSLNFDTYAQKGNEFVNLVSEQLEIHDRNRAGRITRCVLHALRERLTLTESIHLLAQLPMALKGVYVDGWKAPSKQPSSKRFDDFIDTVFIEDGRSVWKDFSNRKEVIEAIAAVFRSLAVYLSQGEIENIMGVLPSYLRIFVKESLTV